MFFVSHFIIIYIYFLCALCFFTHIGFQQTMLNIADTNIKQYKPGILCGKVYLAIKLRFNSLEFQRLN